MNNPHTVQFFIGIMTNALGIEIFFLPLNYVFHSFICTELVLFRLFNHAALQNTALGLFWLILLLYNFPRPVNALGGFQPAWLGKAIRPVGSIGLPQCHKCSTGAPILQTTKRTFMDGT